MDCDAWIMAAKLLDRHGVDALAVISNQIETLTRVVQSSWNAEDAEMLMF
jgi:hypothetical protein